MKKMEPGDLIEIFRGAYEHWAIYVGGGEVVHLVTSSHYSGHVAKTAMVKREKLEDVVGDDDWRVNNLLDDKYTPCKSDIIVKEALKMVGQELKYSLTSKNCEHFVTNLRYGKPESRQVKRATRFGIVGLIFGAPIAAIDWLIGKKK